MIRSPALMTRALFAFTLLAVPLHADIVVLTTGEFIKVSGYEVTGDSLRLELPFGGTMAVKMSRVDRVLDDEIGDESLIAEELGSPGVDVGFIEGAVLPSTKYTDLFEDIGRKYALNPRLLASIAQAESSFRASALSEKGAMGLMQVMPATARRFGVDPDHLYDPQVSLDVGARYLSVLRRRYDGDLTLMLAAYNAGEAAVERFGGVPPYRETQTYIDRVYRTYTEGPG